MKIVHITSHLQIGGVPRAVVSLCRALQTRGHQVIIASGGGVLEQDATSAGVVHWTLPLHTSVEFGPRVFAASQRLQARLRQEHADVLHAHTRVGQVVADRLSRTLHIPYVTTWHGFFRRNFGRRLWPCTGALTMAISEPVRQHLLRDFHVAPQRIRLIPHGIDPTPFEVLAAPTAHAAFRAQVGLPPNGPVVGTMTRLVASKGVDQLLKGFVQIRAAMPQAHLLILGDGEERATLERLAATLGIHEAVHFAGALPETALALSCMDVFVFLPAEEEGFGLSLLEAMASGRPIVAVRRGGGATWVLEESRVGSLVEADQPQQLAQAVVQLLQHDELARQSAAQARAIVKERYALARMVDQVEAVYRAVLTP